MGEPDEIRALIVDDHPVVRKGLRSCLARRRHFKVVGEAADGEEALRKTRELAPDVVVMDIDLPDRSGIEVTELLRREAPSAKVLALTIYTSGECILGIIRAGAHGYIHKGARSAEVVRAIESVCQGQRFFSPETMRAALSHLVSRSEVKERLARLNARERQILILIAEGLDNHETAGRLGISARTVEGYRQRLMRKVEVQCLAGLIKFAIRAGLVSVERKMEPAVCPAH